MKSLASANCRSALVFFSVIATASLPWAALDGVTSFVFDEQESPALKGRTLVDSQGFSAASGACRPLSGSMLQAAAFTTTGTANFFC